MFEAHSRAGGMRLPTLGFILLAAVCLAVAAAFAPSGAASAQTPAARSLLNMRFNGVAVPSSTVDLVQSVVDFSPGASSHLMTIDAAHYLSVIEGELTIEVDGEAQAVAAGKGITTPAGAKVSIKNGGSAKARLAASTLLAPGATAEIHVLSAAGIATFGTARKTFTNLPAVIDIVQQVPEYDVGFKTPNHVMNHPHYMLMLSGTTEFAYLDGYREQLTAGRQGEMYPARAGYMANVGTAKNSFFVTWLATPGAPLTSAATVPGVAPAPPNTGDSQALDTESWGGNGLHTFGAVIAAAGLLGVVIAAGRARRRVPGA